MNGIHRIQIAYPFPYQSDLFRYALAPMMATLRTAPATAAIIALPVRLEISDRTAIRQPNATLPRIIKITARLLRITIRYRLKEGTRLSLRLAGTALGGGGPPAWPKPLRRGEGPCVETFG